MENIVQWLNSLDTVPGVALALAYSFVLLWFGGMLGE